MNDPFQTAEYELFVSEMAKYCRCSPPFPCPCDGVLAGGMCDDMGNGDDNCLKELFEEGEDWW